MPDLQGHTLPTWPEIVEREYEQWDREPIRIDTAETAIEQAVAMISSHMERIGATPETF
jgi:hypothetical protein